LRRGFDPFYALIRNEEETKITLPTMANTAVETTPVATEYPRCLPASDLTYIGQGKHITLEQNDWLGHAVTTQTAALLLREVLGFNVTLLETPMNWGNDQDNSLTRLVSGQVDVSDIVIF
jgi:hypothetical protein